jgi:prepilin-type N-terminal cleavage/methylation domain-containing protein
MRLPSEPCPVGPTASRALARSATGSTKNLRRAFTLIELLTVIAIIGILVAIIVPTASSARLSAQRAKTRTQFSQWAIAIENFRQEYGYYPTFDTTNLVNPPGQSTSANAQHRFHDTLVGKRRDGSALPAIRAGNTANPLPPESQNPRLISFITFTESDLVPSNYSDTTVRNLIRDAFDNTKIAVLVDKNLDGVIKVGGGLDYTTLPAVSPVDNASALRPNATDFPTGTTGGIRAGVAFYSAMPGATDPSQLIFSWK